MAQRITFAGDSIVHGGPWQEWLPDYAVTNFAVPGHTTSDLNELSDAIVESKPQLLIVMIGTNDFGKYRLSEGEVIQNVLTQIRKLRALLPDTPIIWSSLSPRSDEFSESMVAVNAAIKPVIEGLEMTYLDVFTLLKDPEKNVIERVYCEDPDSFGLHLTRSGYQAWFVALAPLISQILRRDPFNR